MGIHRKSYDVPPPQQVRRGFPPLASAPTPKEQEEGGWMLPGGTHLQGKGTPVIKRRLVVRLSACLSVCSLGCASSFERALFMTRRSEMGNLVGGYSQR